jgi:hypothetical protein
MVDSDYFLFTLLVIYCAASLFMFAERLIYFIRCTYDSNFRKKQPVLWRKSTVQDMILMVTFTWLPILIIKTIVDGLKS